MAKPIAPEAGAGCPHLATCPGCPSMRLPYDAQLAEKGARVRRAFARYDELAGLAVAEVAAADPKLGYRTRVKWMVGPRAEIGLYGRGGHEVVDIPGCVIARPVLARVGRALRELGQDPTHGPRVRALRAVDARAIEPAPAIERAIVTLVAERAALGDDEARALASALRERVPEVEAAGLSETDPGAIQILGPETRLLLGDAVQTDRVGSAELRVTFGAFVQAHRGQAAAIERMLVEECRGFGDAPRVLELFAGSGAFGIALGGAGATVDAVESFAPGARLIADAARARALPVRAHAEDAGAFVRSATDRRARWDLVLVDPPRRGLSPDLREALAALAPRAVAYVSCSPETLARDLAHLSRLGLAARALAALDMMPQTDEVECVAWMEPSAPAPPRVVLDGPGFSIVELQPHEPVPLPAVSAPPPGGSGLAALRTSGAAAPEITSWTALALVKGVAHKRGTIRGRTHHVRLAVGSGHSLVRVSGAGAPAQAAADLASVGHPVLGDPKRTDEATRRHFFDKRGLDRAAWHTIEIVLGRHGAVRSKLAADLAAVLAGLGIDPPA